MSSLALADPVAIDVEVTDDELTVKLEDGRTVSVPIDWYPRLAHGSPAERQNYQIFGGGHGIEWPDLDEHIRVGALLEGKRSYESEQSLQRWLDERSTAD